MHDIFLMLNFKVLNQDETPLFYSSVFSEGVVNNADSIVIFNAVLQSLDFSSINCLIALKLYWTFLYPFFTSTALGIAVSCFCSCFLLLIIIASSFLYVEHTVNKQKWQSLWHNCVVLDCKASSSKACYLVLYVYDHMLHFLFLFHLKVVFEKIIIGLLNFNELFVGNLVDIFI